MTDGTKNYLTIYMQELIIKVRKSKTLCYDQVKTSSNAVDSKTGKSFRFR